MKLSSSIESSESHGCSRPTSPSAERPFFLEALYPHARLFRGILLFYEPRYFDADHDLVTSIATVKSRRELSVELHRFHHHPFNHGWLRRTLRMRISTRRLRRLTEMRLKINRSLSQVAA